MNKEAKQKIPFWQMNMEKNTTQKRTIKTPIKVKEHVIVKEKVKEHLIELFEWKGKRDTPSIL